MEEILKQIQLIEGMGLDTRTECFMQLQQVKKLKQLVEQQLKNCNLQNVMPMFADDSNAGNIKRAELIADYKSKIPNWTGDYGQGFADAFNWLCRTFKANLV